MNFCNPGICVPLLLSAGFAVASLAAFCPAHTDVVVQCVLGGAKTALRRPCRCAVLHGHVRGTLEQLRCAIPAQQKAQHKDKVVDAEAATRNKQIRLHSYSPRF